jgi:hypothetical protein
MLSQQSKKQIIELVREVGEEIKDKILPTPEIPKRNAFAHIWKKIKQHFGKSYKECDDADIPKILEIIEECRRNPL